jgi:hypothetical protein
MIKRLEFVILKKSNLFYLSAEGAKSELNQFSQNCLLISANFGGRATGRVTVTIFASLGCVNTAQTNTFLRLLRIHSQQSEH